MDYRPLLTQMLVRGRPPKTPLRVTSKKLRSSKILDEKTNKQKERHRVNLSFSPDEFSELTEKIGNQKPSTFCKNVALGNLGNMNKKGKSKYKKCDPKLLFQISQIGNNLNQITRLGHQAKKANDLELLALYNGIEVIQKQLENLIKSNVS